jgi:ribonuclease Z
MFEEELAATAAEKKHLTAAQAARIAREADVKEMGLIHYSPRYSERELKKLLQEAREIFPGSFLTRDLQHIDMPFED